MRRPHEYGNLGVLLRICLLSAVVCGSVVLEAIKGVGATDQSNYYTNFHASAFGAKGDGVTDNTQALLNVWKAACASTGNPRIFISKGTYLTKPVTFSGPCFHASTITFVLKGTLLAPTYDEYEWGQDWINFEHVDKLTVSGDGIFDGRGSTAWPHNDCPKILKNCKLLSPNLRFNFVTNSTIRRISSLNSKWFHIVIMGSQTLRFHDIRIEAPKDSPNTDGIHIGDSNDIHITQATIKTGDDCISMGSGTKDVFITKVYCGPGHGISIGSLGRYENEKDVEGVRVNNCTIDGTMNGLRIKTWAGEDTSATNAKDFRFENIIMNQVNNPIIIDQHYCPAGSCPQNVGSKVKISNVNFKNVWGTSASKVAVKLDCSEANPCEGVQLTDINLQYYSGGGAVANCSNVKGFSNGTQIPPPCI